ncbi:MAG: cysteine desulfurase family protein [Patescibacteria group bacterium]
MSHSAASANTTIYLDYAATTPVDPLVLNKMLPYFGAEYSNASSMHASGRRAAQVIAKVRREVADILVCSSDEIIFTGSGTESDNLALKGVAHANRTAGNHIIISAIEHKAVMESAKQLEKEGFSVSILPVDTTGMIDIDKCLSLITAQTVLISVMYANNEIGTIEPIRELTEAVQKWRTEYGSGSGAFPLVHTDACQAAGSLELDVNKLGVDLMSLNGSKIYGPKGVGLLYKKRSVRIEPLVVGGEQERMLRAGTESLPSIVGFGEALKFAHEIRKEESVRLVGLREYFIENLLRKIPQAIVNGHRNLRLPNNVHISIPHIEGESILLMLDHAGIEASTGSACSALDLRPSHVLMAIGQSAEFAHGSIRFSLGRHTTREDMDYVLSVFPGITVRLSNMSALTASFS